MEAALYTVHSRGRTNELRCVGDGKRPLGVIPPFWALWNGLWINLLVMLAVLVLTGIWHPLALRVVWIGLLLIVVMEGAALERLELWLRGWREVGLVVAQSPEGAEELYLTESAA